MLNNIQDIEEKGINIVLVEGRFIFNMFLGKLVKLVKLVVLRNFRLGFNYGQIYWSYTCRKVYFTPTIYIYVYIYISQIQLI